MITVVVIVLALVLRLAWAVPVADPSRSVAAAFGEHALCLAAPGDAAAPTGRSDDAPAAPGGHADHDAAKCCQSHPAGELLLPSAGPATRVVFTTPTDRFIAPGVAPTARRVGHGWARAPPVVAA